MCKILTVYQELIRKDLRKVRKGENQNPPR